MTTREHRRDRQERSLTPPSPSELPAETASGEEGSALLAAADAAIERALSGEPEEFLLQNRQQGGQ